MWLSPFNPGLDGLLPFLDDRTHLLCRVEFGLNMFEAVPGQHAQQIGGDQDLPVTIPTGSDADSWNRKPFGQFLRDGRGNQFQNDGKHARLDQGVGISQQSLVLRRALAFDMVSPLFEHMLWKHSQVAEKWNPV